MIVIKVVQSILLLTTEILITTLVKKRIEYKRIKEKVQMVIVIIVDQEDGMAMPTRKHSQKISIKETKKKMYVLGDNMVKHIKGWDLSAKLDH